MKTTDLILGIQCAATKTIVALSGYDAKIQRFEIFPPVAFSIQRNASDELIPLLVMLARGDASWRRDLQKVQHVSCGVSGLHSMSQHIGLKRALANYFRETSPRLSIEEDVWFDLAATGLATGFVVMVSTGVNIAFRSETNHMSIGGHGSELSDRGGGYYVGRRALMLLLDFCDERRLVSRPFVDHLLKTLSIPRPKYAVEWYETIRNTREWRSAVSTVAKSVVECAEENHDFTALEILNESCGELNRTILSLFRLLRKNNLVDDRSDLPFVFCGGLLLNSKTFRASVESTLSSFRYLIQSKNSTGPLVTANCELETVVGCIGSAIVADQSERKIGSVQRNLRDNLPKNSPLFKVSPDSNITPELED